MSLRESRSSFFTSGSVLMSGKKETFGASIWAKPGDAADAADAAAAAAVAD